MTPYDLQEALKKRLKELFEGETFASPREDVEQTTLQFFSQRVPDKTEEEDEFYPLVLIKIVDGGKSKNEEYKINIDFVIGIFDERSDNQGSRDVLHIINKTLKDLQQNPMVDGVFEMTEPYYWGLADENTEPYYFGGITASFIAPEAIMQPPEEARDFL